MKLEKTTDQTVVETVVVQQPLTIVTLRQQLQQHNQDAIEALREKFLKYADLLIEYYKKEIIQAAKERYTHMRFSLTNFTIAEQIDVEIDSEKLFPDFFYEHIESYFNREDVQVTCKIYRDKHIIRLKWN